MKSQKSDREIYSTFSPLGKRFSRSSNRSRVFVGSSIIMSRGFRKPASSLSFPVLRNHPPRGGKVFLAALKAVEQCYRMQMRLDSVLQAVPPQIQGIGRNFREKDPRFQTFSSPIWPALDFSPCSFRFDFLSQGNEILNGCPLESAFLAMFDVLLPLLPLGQVSVWWAGKMFSCLRYLLLILFLPLIGSSFTSRFVNIYFFLYLF